MDDNEFQTLTQQVARLVQRANALPDDTARATALELLQAVMDFHGATLSRIVKLLSGSEAHRASLSKLATDPLICGLLVLYGIHPVSLEQRVADAIEKLRLQLQKQGAEVELLAIGEDGIRVKVSRPHALAASPVQIRQTVEQAILEAAPEIAHLTIEGITSAAFVPVDQIQTVTKEKAYEESTARY
jgi:hypothetical protein